MLRILCLLLCLNLIPALAAGEAAGEGAAPAADAPKSAPAPAPGTGSETPKGAPGSEAPKGGPGGPGGETGQPGGGPTGDPAKQGDPEDDPPKQSGGGMFNLIMIGLAVFLVFLFISQGRAQKREKATREQMLENMKVGDKVVTIGGLHGEVVKKGEGTVDLKTNEMPGGQVTFSLSAVAKVNPDESVATADKDKDA